jgi:hypothetical protein
MRLTGLREGSSISDGRDYWLSVSFHLVQIQTSNWTLSSSTNLVRNACDAQQEYPYLKACWSMGEDPITRGTDSQIASTRVMHYMRSIILIGFRSEREEVAMCVFLVIMVIRSVSFVAPDYIAALQGPQDY